MVKKYFFLFSFFLFLFLLSIFSINATECSSNGNIFCQGNNLCYTYTSNYNTGACSNSCSNCGSGYTCTLLNSGDGECISTNQLKQYCPNPQYPFFCSNNFCGSTQGWCNNVNTGQNSGYCDWTNYHGNNPQDVICCNTGGTKVSQCMIPTYRQLFIASSLTTLGFNQSVSLDLMDYFGGSSFDATQIQYPTVWGDVSSALTLMSYGLGDTQECGNNGGYKICFSTNTQNHIIMDIQNLDSQITGTNQLRLTAFNSETFFTTFFNSPSLTFFITLKNTSGITQGTGNTLSSTFSTTNKTGEKIYVNQDSFLDSVNLGLGLTADTCWVYRDGFGLLTNVSVQYNGANIPFISFPSYTIPLISGESYRIECGNLNGSSYTSTFSPLNTCIQQSPTGYTVGDGDCNLNYTGYNVGNINNFSYIKPQGSLSSSQWYVYFGNQNGNFNIPSDCWNLYSNKVVLYAQGNAGNCIGCYNSTGQHSFGSCYILPERVYSQNMIWNVNPSLNSNSYFSFTNSSVNEMDNGINNFYNIQSISVSGTTVCKNVSGYGVSCCPFTYPIMCYNSTITNSTGGHMNLSTQGQCAKTQGFCNNYYKYFQGNESYCYVDSNSLTHCCNDNGLNIAQCGTTPNILKYIPNQDLTSSINDSVTLHLNDYFSNYDSIALDFGTNFSNFLNIPLSITQLNFNSGDAPYCDTSSGISICVNYNSGDWLMTITSLGNDVLQQVDITPYDKLAFSTLFFNGTSEVFTINTSSLSSQNSGTSGESFVKGIGGWFAMIFPDASSLTIVERFAIIFVVMLIVDILIFLLAWGSKSELGGALLIIILVLDVLLFFFFTAIGYIPIGVVVVIALILLVLGFFKIFKGGN